MIQYVICAAIRCRTVQVSCDALHTRVKHRKDSSPSLTWRHGTATLASRGRRTRMQSYGTASPSRTLRLGRRSRGKDGEKSQATEEKEKQRPLARCAVGWTLL